LHEGGILVAIIRPERITSRKVIAECRKEYCELCGRSAPGEPHHIRPRSLGGSDIKENLIELCTEDHQKAQEGIIPYSVLVAVVAEREGMSIADVCVLIGWPIPDEKEIITPVVPAFAGRTLDELLQEYISLQESEDDTHWSKGAVCLVFTEGMGASASKVASWFGISAAQVRELVKTFKAFPEESKRVPDLDWMHHRIAANTLEPDKWIAEAADNDMSTRQMQEKIDVACGKIKSEDSQKAKAEKALLLTKEVLSEEDASADWLRAQLLDLIMPMKAVSGL
jgi:hypothetical protein